MIQSQVNPWRQPFVVPLPKQSATDQDVLPGEKVPTAAPSIPAEERTLQLPLDLIGRNSSFMERFGQHMKSPERKSALRHSPVDV